MFGRIVLIAVLLVVALGAVVRTSHGAAPERVYVVRPTDTLWSIASRAYGGDVRAAIWQIEQRNGLRTATLGVGQRLVLP